MKNKFRSLILLLVVGFFLFSITESSAKPIYGDPLSQVDPALQVQKWISDEAAKLNSRITVTVNITNWSEAWAFNLSISEPVFSKWAVSEFVGFEKYTYLEFGPGATLTYRYEVILKAAGNYIIEPTTIDYVDENGTSYQARSSFANLEIFIEDPPLDNSELWRNTFTFSVILISIPIIVLIINRALWRT